MKKGSFLVEVSVSSQDGNFVVAGTTAIVGSNKPCEKCGTGFKAVKKQHLDPWLIRELNSGRTIEKETQLYIELARLANEKMPRLCRACAIEMALRPIVGSA